MASVQGDLGWDDLIQADYKSDGDLEVLESDLKAGADKVMKMSTGGLDRFKQCILYLRYSDKKTVETIMSCKRQIHAAKGHEATAIEKLVDQFLIKQYLENSNKTLEFLKVELPDFIEKAGNVNSRIKDVVGKPDERKLKKLRTAKDNYHRSAQAIVAKIKSLQDGHLKFLGELKAEFSSLKRKLEGTHMHTVKKVVHVIFIGVLCTVFACSVMAAIMAGIPGFAAAHPSVAAFFAATAIAQSSTPGIQAGQHWLLTMIRESESLQARQNLNESMQSGTKDAIKVLGDIMSHVEEVIKKEKSCKLSSSDLDEKMEKFQEEIKELKKTGEECIPVIEKAREEVVKNYNSLKKALGRSTRN